MNLFSRKSAVPPTPSGPEAFASNSAYGRGFFEPGAFVVALKRCENGHDLSQQLAEMFAERAQIELAYATQLRTWSRYWHEELAKSQEYGSNKRVWERTAKTGEYMADVHATLSTSLTELLIPKLRQWRKDHYEKSMLHYKITKEFDRDFLDAQKSWSKLLDRFAECKSAYYSACKAIKAAEDAERTAASEEQRKKYADKADVARREVGFTKTKYQQAFQETGEQRPQYEQAMRKVFERTQQFEKKRLDFFKQMFEEYAKLLELASIDNVVLRSMNEDYRAALATHQSQQDVTWWDEYYGTKTNCRWPQFEEYRD